MLFKAAESIQIVMKGGQLSFANCHERLIVDLPVGFVIPLLGLASSPRTNRVKFREIRVLYELSFFSF